MPTSSFRLAILAATLAFGAAIAAPAQAQIPTLPPGAGEAATEAAAEAVRPRARRAAPRKVAAKKPTRRAARGEAVPRGGAIVVTNRRDSNLVELTATPTKGGAPIVIARDVAPGARASGKLPAKAGCVFSLSGAFEDESSMEAANMNLCKDGRINLVE